MIQRRDEKGECSLGVFGQMIPVKLFQWFPMNEAFKPSATVPLF